jgi:hypothetical protein
MAGSTSSSDRVKGSVWAPGSVKRAGTLRVRRQANGRGEDETAGWLNPGENPKYYAFVSADKPRAIALVGSSDTPMRERISFQMATHMKAAYDEERPIRILLLIESSFRRGQRASQSGSLVDGLAESDRGKTLCSGAGIGMSPLRSLQRNLLSRAVSTASTWLKSRSSPSFHSSVFIW